MSSSVQGTKPPLSRLAFALPDLNPMVGSSSSSRWPSWIIQPIMPRSADNKLPAWDGVRAFVLGARQPGPAATGPARDCHAGKVQCERHAPSDRGQRRSTFFGLKGRKGSQPARARAGAARVAVAARHAVHGRVPPKIKFETGFGLGPPQVSMYWGSPCRAAGGAPKSGRTHQWTPLHRQPAQGRPRNRGVGRRPAGSLSGGGSSPHDLRSSSGDADDDAPIKD